MSGIRLCFRSKYKIFVQHLLLGEIRGCCAGMTSVEAVLYMSLWTTRQQGRSMSNCSRRYWADRRCLKPSGVLCVWKTALAASWSHEEVTVQLWAGLQRFNWSIGGSCSAAMVKAWSQLCVRFEQLDSRNLSVRWPPTEVRCTAIFTLWRKASFHPAGIPHGHSAFFF